MIPNATAVLYKQTGNNAYGEPIVAPGVTCQVAVVRLTHLAQQTSVRADRSASHANASEIVDKGKILFDPAIVPSVGDRLDCRGLELVISSTEDRYGVEGNLDHYEVIVEVWEP